MQENKKEAIFLDFICKEFKIFIDTCSLLDDMAYIFFENIKPFLKAYNKKIIIPSKVIEELEKHSQNSDPNKLELVQNATRMLYEILPKLKNDGFIEIIGEKNEPFADAVFHYVFDKFRTIHRLLLITQDNKLAKDILNKNESESVKGHKIFVRRINPKNGFLMKFYFDAQNEQPLTSQDISKQAVTNSLSLKSKPFHSLAEEQPFKIDSIVTNIVDEKINISHIPVENEMVFTRDKDQIKLIKKIAEGGEGIVYETDFKDNVAKIYNCYSNTQRRYEKLKLMTSKNIAFKGICYPTKLLCNKKDEFVGYLMPKASGKTLGKSLFIKPLFLKNFPNWRKQETVELSLTILQKISYLHSKNIILGDINPENILLVSPKEVYFVDTDSYQIENFPCPVGTINYTAPEIQGRHYPDFLRTMGNENFALATLLFMIMIPGKPPYSQQGGGDPVKNITSMDFSYPFGDNSNKKTPDGPWRFIWSHLPYRLKEAFYNTFKDGEKHSKENVRLGVEQWIEIFKDYKNMLDSNKLAQTDQMSEDIYPTRYKKHKDLNYIKCILCGNEISEDASKDGYCNSCLFDKGEFYKCQSCGKDMFYTNHRKFILKQPKLTICSECNNLKKEIVWQENCVNCGKSIMLTRGEYDFYMRKNLSLPKRCKKCRQDIASKNGFSTLFTILIAFFIIWLIFIR